MILGEKEIKRRVKEGSIYISPYVEDHVEPASVDLRLGTSFNLVSNDVDLIDTHDENSVKMKRVEQESIVLEPGGVVLGTTMEVIGLPDDLAAKVEGRSSLGRLHVVIHKTAGFVDPGWHGELTLEIENDNDVPVRLHAGDRVAQIWFTPVKGGIDTPYGDERGSQYQGQRGATGSGMEFEPNE